MAAIREPAGDATARVVRVTRAGHSRQAGNAWRDDELSKTLLAVENRRPGTVVTVSRLHRTGRLVAAADLARIAAAVDVPT